MEDPVRPPKGFVAGNDRLDRMLAKRPVDRAAVDAEKDYYGKRDEAARKVAAFLKANYPCDCGDDCDELDEACSIVEIVESVVGYIRWETPSKRPWPTTRTSGTQRYIDSGEYEGEYDAER